MLRDPGRFPTSGAPLPASFANLISQEGNYPVSEGTSIITARLDHKFNSNHSGMLRVNVSPSTMTGLQVQGQNQNFGQNAFSRTAIQQFRDWAITPQETATLGNSKINELRFQYAYRGLLFNFNQDTPDGPNVAVNIQGYAFIGREPYSYIRRTEQRYQFADNFSVIKGTHNFKFGADVNHLPVVADFAVNFGGVYNFGDLSASTFGLPNTFPSFPAFQAYGLGIPQTYIQGVGNPHASFHQHSLGILPPGLLANQAEPDAELWCAIRRGNYAHGPTDEPTLGRSVLGAGNRPGHPAGHQQCGAANRAGLGPVEERQDGGARVLRDFL